MLYKEPMVLALLARRKTQTRRVIKPEWLRCLDPADPDDLTRVIEMCPYGRVGDRLWVRETWARGDTLTSRSQPLNRTIRYRADNGTRTFKGPGAALYFTPDTQGAAAPKRWNSPFHLRRAESRLTLQITEVRVQPLQAICVDDARAEGLTEITPDGGKTFLYGVTGWEKWLEGDWDPDPRVAYLTLWNKINGKRQGCSWNDNPWVWALSFEVLP